MGCGGSIKRDSCETGSPEAEASAKAPEAAGAEAAAKAPAAEAAPKLSVVGDGDPYRGLSVKFLNGKLLDLLNLTTKSEECIYHCEPRVRELGGPPLVCPRDGRPGCALVDVAPDDCAGRANHMMSYGWGYRVLDITTALASYCERKSLYPKQVVVWMCFACINQHRVKESQAKGISVPFKEFEATFRERVTGIAKMLCLLSPWNNPLYVQRVWCVFELYTASTTPHVGIELILPPREAHRLENTIATEGLDKLWHCLAQLAVENAKASVEEDRRTILKLVDDGPGSAYVNAQVQNRLRHWFADMVVSSLQSKLKNTMAEDHEAKEIVATAINATRYWQLQGASISEVSDFAEKIYSFSKGTMGPTSDECALAAGGVAWAAMLASHFDKAISMYQEILEIQKKNSGTLTKEYGSTMYDLGWALCSKGDYREAVRVLGEAKVIQAQVPGKTDVTYGRTMRDMGEAMIELQEFDSALEAYEEAVGTLESAVGRYHPDTCIALKHQCRVFIAKNDTLKAVKQLDEVLIYEEDTVGSQSCDHTITRLILSDALRVSGRFARALYICDECLILFDSLLGRQTKFGLWTLWNRGRILHDMGLDDRAQTTLKEALKIAEAIAGTESARYKSIEEELRRLQNGEELDMEVSMSKQDSVYDSCRPWGEGDEEALLAKFKELDVNHVGLIEFGEVLKLVKTLLERNLEEAEIQALSDAARIAKDLTRNRRVNFRAFQNLGEAAPGSSIPHIHQAIGQYFDELVTDYMSGSPLSAHFGSRRFMLK